MNINIYGIINFIGKSLVVFVIEIMYRFFSNVRNRENKYIVEEEMKEDIEKLIDTFKALVICTAIVLGIKIRLWGTNESLFSSVIVLGVFILSFVASRYFIKWQRKHEWILLWKDTPDILNKLMNIYEIDVLFGERYFLSQRGWRLAKIVKFFEVIYLAYFLACYDPEETLKIGVTATVFPLFVLVFLLEIKQFLSGYTKEEYNRKVLRRDTRKIGKQRVIIISDNLVRQLKKFKLAVKSEYNEKEKENEKDRAVRDEYEYNLLSDFFEKRGYENKEEKYNIDYLIAPAASLLKKQNVIFHTYFYKDLELAVFFPMMLHSYKGKKNLVIINSLDFDKEINWIKQSIERMSGIYDYIKCKKLEDATTWDDIIVMDYNQFLNWKDNTYLKNISVQIELIFLVEPSLRTMEELEEIDNLKTYIEENGGNANIVISDSHQEFAERMMWSVNSKTVYKGPYRLSPKQYTIILWDADIADDGDTERGELEAKIVHILKEKMEQGGIIWINQNVRPSVDIWWHYQKHEKSLDRIELQHMESGRELEASKETYYIIEDSECNYITVAERFLSRAEERGLICIMEPNYLLRNYLIENSHIKKEIQKGIKDRFINENFYSERNSVMLLIRKVYIEKFIDIDEIKTELFETPENKNIKYIIGLIKEYFPELSVNIIKEIRNKGRTKYKIAENEAIDIFFAQENDLFVYHDRKEMKAWDGINYHNVFQKYLPGQNIVFNGKRYMFINVEEVNKQYILKVRRNLDRVDKREYYRQKRIYVLQKYEIEANYLNPMKNIRNIYMETICVVLQCYTEGYIKLPRFNDFCNGIFVKKQGIPERRFYNKRALHIVIPRISPEAEMYFAIILKEMLYTLCPDSIDYLGVGISVSEYEGSLYQKYLYKGIVWGVKEAEDGIYIVEDCIHDIGILEVIERKMDFILELMLSYVNWYIMSEEKYLLFGFDDSEDELKNILNELKIGIVGEENIEKEEIRWKKEKDESERVEITISKAEAQNIFAEVLVDMFYFRDLNVNIGLKPYFVNSTIEEKSGSKRKKKNKRIEYVEVDRNVSRKEFYWQCAYKIIMKYNEVIFGDITEKQGKKYADDYIDILFAEENIL